jgi:hypothetical protein
MFPAQNWRVENELDKRASVPWQPHVSYTLMKKLLLLGFIAVAYEAMAQDGQCVRERAAMVETVRAYARSEADVLGPQGISQRVLEVMGQAERHRFPLGVLVQSHTWTRPFALATARRCLSRS